MLKKIVFALVVFASSIHPSLAKEDTLVYDPKEVRAKFVQLASAAGYATAPADKKLTIVLDAIAKIESNGKCFVYGPLLTGAGALRTFGKYQIREQEIHSLVVTYPGQKYTIRDFYVDCKAQDDLVGNWVKQILDKSNGKLDKFATQWW